MPECKYPSAWLKLYFFLLEGATVGAFSLSIKTIEDELVLSGIEFEGFSRHGKQLVPHAHEAADGEHHVNQAAISGVDQQSVDLPDSHPGDRPPPRFRAPNGASTSSILRHRRRAELIRLLTG
jgi:hypothetical protein